MPTFALRASPADIPNRYVPAQLWISVTPGSAAAPPATSAGVSKSTSVVPTSRDSPCWRSHRWTRAPDSAERTAAVTVAPDAARAKTRWRPTSPEAPKTRACRGAACAVITRRLRCAAAR